MRRMDAKVMMLAAGMFLGGAIVSILDVLVEKGGAGHPIFVCALLLSLLALAVGWIFGLLTRMEMDQNRIWMQGYKEGRESLQKGRRTMFFRIDEPGH